MEQIIVYELPRYLSLIDRNVLCSLNKEYYAKLRPITPRKEEIKLKQVIQKELKVVTRPLYNSTIHNCRFINEKIRRMFEGRRKTFNLWYDKVRYDYYMDDGVLRTHLIVPKNYKPKYIWFPIMCIKSSCRCHKIEI